MKKTLILLLLFLGHQLLAQETHIQSSDKKFVHLDKSKISTNILYDRVIPFGSATSFGMKEDKMTNTSRFTQIFTDMQSASYKNKYPISSESIKATISKYNFKKQIPFGLLSYTFNSIDSKAIEKGLLQYKADSTLVETGNPYLTNELSMFIALQSEELYTGTSVFVYAPDLVFGNQSNQIESVSINFGENNQTVTFSPQTAQNKEFSVNYTGGNKTLTYTLSLKNGKKQTYTSTLSINARVGRNDGVCYVPPMSFPSLGFYNIQANIPFYNYPNDTEHPLDTPYGEGEVGYYYADGKLCNNGSQPITKPIIILDGFDPLDTRTIPAINEENLIYKDATGTTKNLVADLQIKGYDVIILNFPKSIRKSVTRPSPFPPYTITENTYQDYGAGYVERNAMTLIKLIQQTNDSLQKYNSTEKLTIVGTSMGGLISRYALAYMEKYGMAHNTKLWVSFDAPHNGANIPIGAQEFLRYWGGEGSDGSQRNYTNKINSVAARQFLLHHRNQPVGFPNTPQVNWYRNTFVANLQNNGLSGSNGYPMNLRKVAVANGSQAGALTGFSGQMNLEMNLHIQMFNGNFMRVGGSQTSSTRSYGDFGEGNTPKNLRLGDNCQAKFATAGTKTLRFELLLSNGKKHTTYATLEVL